MKVLICSILRNNEPNMQRYISQINSILDHLGSIHEFSISLYENDSTDNTANIIRSMDLSRFKDSSVVCEKVGLPPFGSFVSEERVKNLARARNKALLAKDMYLDADYILFIDCDVAYDKDFIPSLLNFSKLPNTPDVYSGNSITLKYTSNTATNNTESEIYLQAKPSGLPQQSGIYRVYDTWGTRRTESEEWGTWFGNSSIYPLAMFWATYNSVCLYNAKPFKEGIRFDHVNDRLGKFDLEVAVVCEKFRNAGYNKIWINQGLFCFHE